MSAPYEIFAGPFTAWLGTANSVVSEPADLDAAPGGSWTKLGANGSDNYNEDGVVFSPEDTLEYFRGLGKTAKLKAFRTEEDPMVSFQVHDVRPEVMSHALNGNAITTVAAGASTSGRKKVALYKGHAVTTYSLLLRSDAGSPYGDSYITQLWMPVVCVDSVDEITFKKGDAAGLAFDFALLYDSSNGLGAFSAQNAVKTS